MQSILLGNIQMVGKGMILDNIQLLVIHFKRRFMKSKRKSKRIIPDSRIYLVYKYFPFKAILLFSFIAFSTRFLFQDFSKIFCREMF